MATFSELQGQLVLKISREDLNESNTYVGADDVAVPFGGHIELAPGLGLVKFETSVHASLAVKAGDGTGIESRGYIQAGEIIKVGGTIRAAWDIIAGYSIEAKGSVVAGEQIKAGWGIEAGESVKAGLSIDAEGISAGGRILAGIMPWPEPAVEDQQIRAVIWSGEVAAGFVVRPAPVTLGEAAIVSVLAPRGVR
ncbi:MAG: hypothetical protein DI604_28140 [Delftia acidovorans]|nr:MAG: hypothetical protein DI604_28140 [Delftia acidovorans]